MNKITITTKSNDRFQKMRSFYLGNVKKKHITTGYYGQRSGDYASWGFNKTILERHIKAKIYKHINAGGKLEDLVFIDDFTFEAVNCLIDIAAEKQLAIKTATIIFVVENEKDKENIKEWIEDYFAGTEQLKIIYLMKKSYTEPGGFCKNGKPKKDIVTTRWDKKELIDMKKVDLIISNGPYGSIGAEITAAVRDSLDYNLFANLLPANDYKRNAGGNLYNYQSDMESIKNGFAGDATVTTHLALITNKKDNKGKAIPCNNMTLGEFERSQYIDRSLDKYFTENNKRTHYAIDNHICKPKIARFRTIDLRKCFYTGKRDLAAGHLPYSKDTMSYKINFNLLTDHDEFLANSSKSEQALGNSGNYTVVPFNTDTEKDNLINFLYSKNGFRFITKLFTAINVDCYVVPAKYLPKVDWTRSWTVEEILADYGYTGDRNHGEIKEIMADLENFKGMKD